MLARFKGWLIVLPRAAKAALIVTADVAGILVALFLVYSLALRQPDLVADPRLLFLSLVVATVICLACWLLGVYSAVTRYSDTRTLVRVTLAAGIGGVTVLFGSVAVGLFERAWDIAIAFSMLCALGMCAWRLAAARFLAGPTAHNQGTPVAIYGAGSAGRQLAAALRHGRQIRPIAFIDDRKDLRTRIVDGLRVFPPSAVNTLKERGVLQVLLAMPSIGLSRRKQILQQIEAATMKVMVMPGLDELASGAKRVDELREVEIEDLLARDPVPPDPELLHLQVRSKTVLVTGAGGSIGSELARQVHSLGARKLLLLDSCEYALYEIDRQLRHAETITQSGCVVVPILGNVCDERHLRALFSEHAVDTVYHSAAYKHVPLVEANSIAAAHNNINGTERTARAALQAGVQNFVLVSTDKAVRPTSIMGATKRFCELVIQALGQEYPDRSLSMVRFGNVLGSSGSVVPLFREQIRNGGPITVTHPEVTRYFMTIPEAACLVIQAGAMGRNGEVFVLDMGEPVRIRHLAERMVRLCGLTSRDENDPPEKGDIAIRYTGLRPGEKLYEELLIGSNPEATSHSRIMKANEHALEPDAVADAIVQMRHAIEWRNHAELAAILTRTVQGYGAAKQADDESIQVSASHNTARPPARQPA